VAEKKANAGTTSTAGKGNTKGIVDIISRVVQLPPVIFYLEAVRILY
jgi:hypothetical protein